MIDPGSSSPEWQPIETAPRDNSRVLLYENGVVYIGFRHTREHEYWSSESEEHGTGKPTHWRPLPAPPSDAP